MARLTIDQIRAPDLSVASQATARAGESFQRSMSNASDLLSQYQQGLEAQGDAELTNLLAGAKNEDEWNAIVASTDFSNMNLSAGMRENIMNRRDSVLGYEQARSTRAGTDASTMLTNANTRRVDNNTRIATNQDNRAGALHGVAMNDHAWRQGARAEDASLAGLALAAATEGMTDGNGNPVSGLTLENTSGLRGGPGTNLGPRADGSGLRNPNGSSGTDRQIAYRNGIAAIESDGSGGYDAIGANNPTLGRALGRYQIMEANIPAWSRRALGREVSVEEFMANPDIQDAIFDDRFGGYVEKYGEERAARAWFGGEGNVNSTTGSDVHGRLTIGDYGSEFISQLGGSTQNSRPEPRTAITQNPNQGGPAQQRYLDALAASQYQPTDRVLDVYERQYDYNATGEAAITAADTAAAEEAVAQQILDAASGNVTSTEAIVEANNSGQGSTAIEELRRQATILEQAGDGGALDAARLQIGTTGASPQDIAIAETTLTDIRERQNRDPYQFAQTAAAGFVEDPTGSLRSAMDQMNISTVPSELEAAINQLASDTGVTRAEAAYSFARAAEIDTAFVPDWSLGGDNLAQRRAAAFAREHFTGDAAATARAAIGDDRIVVQLIETATQNLGVIERKIQKLRQSGSNVPADLITKRDEARGALTNLYEQHGNRGQNPNQPRAGAVNTSTQTTPRDAGTRLEQSLRQG